jgi:MipA family protein
MQWRYSMSRINRGPVRTANRTATWGCLLTMLFCLLLAQKVVATEVTVDVQGAPATGPLIFLLFDSEDAFDGFRTPLKSYSFPSQTSNACYRLDTVPPGTYALLVYHDENGNGRLDRNFVGIPKESLGFLNGYSPKGAPSFVHASVTISDAATQRFEVPLTKPLGRRGRFGVGVCALGQSSPYRGSTGTPFLAFPAITYIGERVQIFGPMAQIALVGNGDLRLAGTLGFRLGSYEESDSPLLDGLGDRDATMMGGLALKWEWTSGIDVALTYQHDVLDRIGGGASRLGIQRPFRRGRASLTPSVAANWQSSRLANHDFGVPAGNATPERPAYRVGDTTSLEGGLGLSIQFTEHWSAMLYVSREQLDNKVTQSPIVSEDYVLKGFAAVSTLL